MISAIVTLRNTARYTHNDQAYIYTQPDDQQATSTAPTCQSGQPPADSSGGRANTRYGYRRGVVNQTDLYGTAMTGRSKHSFATGLEMSWEEARRGSS
jgi:catecholate siderophore receptor